MSIPIAPLANVKPSTAPDAAPGIGRQHSLGVNYDCAMGHPNQPAC